MSWFRSGFAGNTRFRVKGQGLRCWGDVLAILGLGLGIRGARLYIGYRPHELYSCLRFGISLGGNCSRNAVYFLNRRPYILNLKPNPKP